MDNTTTVVLQNPVSYGCNRAYRWQNNFFSSTKVEPRQHYPSSSTQKQPLGSSGCSQNISGIADDIGAFFNDAYTAIKNMVEGSTTTKYGSPSTPIECPIVPQVEEHVERVKVSSPPPHPEENRTLDDTLDNTIQK